MEIEGYSIFCNGEIETFKKGKDEYNRKMVERTKNQICLLDRKNEYTIKKVKVTYTEID